MGRVKKFQVLVLLAAAVFLAALICRPVRSYAANAEDKIIILTAETSGKTCKVSWNPVNQATRYVLFRAKYQEGGQAGKLKKFQEFSGNILSYNFSMKTGYNYQLKIAAYQGSVKVCKSLPVVTFAGNRDIVGKASRIQAELNTLTLTTGNTIKLNAAVKVIGGTEQQDTVFPPIRYLSNNEAVAVVDANGNVTAKSVGEGRIYLLAVNGVSTEVKVVTSAPVPKNYTIAFEANGGSGQMPAMTPAVSETVNLSANTFTKDGHIFSTWNTRPDGSGMIVSDKAPVTALTAAGNTITLYAQWSRIYTISFDAAGGSQVAAIKIKAGTLAGKPADPTRDGYLFGGWYLKTGQSFDWSKPVNQDVSLVARWDMAFNVTFETNGGSTVPVQKIASGGKVTRPSNPTKPGYTFGGWYTANIQPYNFDKQVTQSMTLYAKWDGLSYTVRFSENGGAGTRPSDIVTNYEGTITLPSNNFTRSHFKANGWNTQADGKGTHYNNGAVVSGLTASSNGYVTLYAEWTGAQYTILYYTDRNATAVAKTETRTYDGNPIVLKPDNLKGSDGWHIARWQVSPSSTYKGSSYSSYYPYTGYTNVYNDTFGVNEGIPASMFDYYVSDNDGRLTMVVYGIWEVNR